MKRLASIILAVVMTVGVVAAVIAPADRADAAPGYTPPPLKVGVVYSTLSQNWCAQYGRGYGILEKEQRTISYLESQGWDVTQLSDNDLKSMSTLRQYDVIILMWVFAMMPTEANNLVKYVAEGGGLVTLYASPRVAPGVGVPVKPGETQETADHWARILNYEGWEWGPLSEMNQTYFIDDWGAIKFFSNPVTWHPVYKRAKEILEARGHSSSDMRLRRDPASWVELAEPLSGNPNMSAFMTMEAYSAATGSNDYRGTQPHIAATTSEYLAGKYAYFYFSPVDFLPNYNQDGIADDVLSSGAAQQGQVAAAYIESAIEWAGGDTKTAGPINRDGRTHAEVSTYYSGIWATHYVTNPGTVSVTGTLYYRIYDPSGKKVKESVRYKIGVKPGGSNKYAESFPSMLKPGKYRIEVEYKTSYPKYRRSYVETLWVQRAAGTNIPTSFDAGRSSGTWFEDHRLERLSGSTRYETALRIADEAGGYPRPGGWVVIANGDAGPDALSAASLAAAYDAPLLLTKKGRLPGEVIEWLTDSSHGISNAWVVGGSGVVDGFVLRQLQALGISPQRAEGADRYGTAADVARKVKAQMGAAYDGGLIVCNGNALADAAGASAVSAGRGWPLVFVKTYEVPEVSRRVMTEVTSGTASPHVWVAGGTSVVSGTVRSQLETVGPVWRADGKNRYETAAKLAQQAVDTGSTWQSTGLASGLELVDALCLGPLLGRANGPLLLTRGTSLEYAAAAKIWKNGAIDTVYVGGGTGAISEPTLITASNALP